VQGVQQDTHNPLVDGSSPSGPTNENKALSHILMFCGVHFFATCQSASLPT
jgi:hypothetical protein